ncbi:MAG: xanthine dehydrogenase small subunit [Burkholderiaceae bacterium]
MSSALCFLLNGKPVGLDAVDPNLTVLDWLRCQARLTGTKEGCAEGDCGACMIAIADARPDGRLHWRAINSCIRLLSSLHGHAVVTVDGLASGGSVHPVQQALVDAHASQCGFCTPGFVMSLYALYRNGGLQTLDRPEVERAFSGNLCRCTGYRPLIDAALALRDASDDAIAAENAVTAGRLHDLMRRSDAGPVAPHDGPLAAGDGPRTAAAVGSPTIDAGARALRPRTVEALLADRARHPGAWLIAGCTDVGLWITKQHRRAEHTIDVTFVTALQSIETLADGRLRIGAAVRLEQAWAALCARWPQLRGFADRFASRPVRNSGTLGGNIANGSPIGDSMPVLIALGCHVVVASQAGGERAIALEAFYAGRQQTVMRTDEVLLWIDVAPPGSSGLVAAYKVSRRIEQDISAVCLGLNIELDDGVSAPVVRTARIGVGGMAATPMRALRTEQVLVGAPWSDATLDLAVRTIRAEFSPITDMRASSRYREHVIGALLIRAWREHRGEPVALDALS